MQAPAGESAAQILSYPSQARETVETCRSHGFAWTWNPWTAARNV